MHPIPLASRACFGRLGLAALLLAAGAGFSFPARAQSVSTGEVAANTEQMARLIEMNSASIVQVRDAVGELKRTADQLRDMVAHFQVNA